MTTEGVTRLIKKTILVTGGRGFIGHHLTDSLRHHNSVIVVDNDVFEQARPFLEGVTYYDKCISEIPDINIPPPDIIIHLGEYSRVEQSFTDINFVLKNNLGTIGPLLTLWKDTGAKLLYAGSSTKFGKDQEDKQVLSPYTLCKQANTNLIKSFADWYGLPYAITYFYNVYGPLENGDSKYATVIEKFIRQKLRGQPLTITRPGTQKRNFTHVFDIVSAIKLVIANGLGDDFGIGNQKSYSILELAKMLDCEFTFNNVAMGNRFDAELITAKTVKLGWAASYNLQDYLKNRLQNELGTPNNSQTFNSK